MSRLIFKSIAAKCSTLFVMSLFVAANINAGGGDVYTIYLNDKLVLKEYVAQAKSGIIPLVLENAKPTDNLVVFYSHCGTTGKGRSIVIKDEKNNTLKEWKFEDAAASTGMTIPMKEILALEKSNANATLTMYYFSSQLLPGGRMLASIQPDGKNTTWLKKATISPATAGIASLMLIGLF
jgi:hypothetical protein